MGEREEEGEGREGGRDKETKAFLPAGSPYIAEEHTTLPVEQFCNLST